MHEMGSTKHSQVFGDGEQEMGSTKLSQGFGDGEQEPQEKVMQTEAWIFKSKSFPYSTFTPFQ